MTLLQQLTETFRNNRKALSLPVGDESLLPGDRSLPPDDGVSRQATDGCSTCHERLQVVTPSNGDPSLADYPELKMSTPTNEVPA